jgi:hypothetical protein
LARGSGAHDTEVIGLRESPYSAALRAAAVMVMREENALQRKKILFNKPQNQRVFFLDLWRGAGKISQQTTLKTPYLYSWDTRFEGIRQAIFNLGCPASSMLPEMDKDFIAPSHGCDFTALRLSCSQFMAITAIMAIQRVPTFTVHETSGPITFCGCWYLNL